MRGVGVRLEGSAVKVKLVGTLALAGVPAVTSAAARAAVKWVPPEAVGVLFSAAPAGCCWRTGLPS